MLALRIAFKRRAIQFLEIVNTAPRRDFSYQWYCSSQKKSCGNEGVRVMVIVKLPYSLRHETMNEWNSC